MARGIRKVHPPSSSSSNSSEDGFVSSVSSQPFRSENYLQRVVESNGCSMGIEKTLLEEISANSAPNQAMAVSLFSTDNLKQWDQNIDYQMLENLQNDELVIKDDPDIDMQIKTSMKNKHPYKENENTDSDKEQKDVIEKEKKGNSKEQRELDFKVEEEYQEVQLSSLRKGLTSLEEQVIRYHFFSCLTPHTVPPIADALKYPEKQSKMFLHHSIDKRILRPLYQTTNPLLVDAINGHPLFSFSFMQKSRTLSPDEDPEEFRKSEKHVRGDTSKIRGRGGGRGRGRGGRTSQRGSGNKRADKQENIQKSSTSPMAKEKKTFEEGYRGENDGKEIEHPSTLTRKYVQNQVTILVGKAIQMRTSSALLIAIKFMITTLMLPNEFTTTRAPQTKDKKDIEGVQTDSSEENNDIVLGENGLVYLWIGPQLSTLFATPSMSKKNNKLVDGLCSLQQKILSLYGQKHDTNSERENTLKPKAKDSMKETEGFEFEKSLAEDSVNRGQKRSKQGNPTNWKSNKEDRRENVHLSGSTHSASSSGSLYHRRKRAKREPKNSDSYENGEESETSTIEVKEDDPSEDMESEKFMSDSEDYMEETALNHLLHIVTQDENNKEKIRSIEEKIISVSGNEFNEMKDENHIRKSQSKQTAISSTNNCPKTVNKNLENVNNGNFQASYLRSLLPLAPSQEISSGVSVVSNQTNLTEDISDLRIAGLKEKPNVDVRSGFNYEVYGEVPDSKRRKFVNSRNLEILHEGYVRVDVVVCLLLTFLEDRLTEPSSETDRIEENSLASPFHLLILHSIIEDLLSLWGGSKAHGKVSKSFNPFEKEIMVPSISLTSLSEPSSPDILVSENDGKKSLKEKASYKKRRSTMTSPSDLSQMSPISSASLDASQQPHHTISSILDGLNSSVSQKYSSGVLNSVPGSHVVVLCSNVLSSLRLLHQLVRKGRINSLSIPTEGSQSNRDVTEDTFLNSSDVATNYTQHNKDLVKEKVDNSFVSNDPTEYVPDWDYSIVLCRLLRSSKVLSKHSFFNVDTLRIPKTAAIKSKENVKEPIEGEFAVRRSARRASQNSRKDANSIGSGGRNVKSEKDNEKGNFKNESTKKAKGSSKNQTSREKPGNLKDGDNFQTSTENDSNLVLDLKPEKVLLLNQKIQQNLKQEKGVFTRKMQLLLESVLRSAHALGQHLEIQKENPGPSEISECSLLHGILEALQKEAVRCWLTCFHLFYPTYEQKCALICALCNVQAKGEQIGNQNVFTIDSGSGVNADGKKGTDVSITEDSTNVSTSTVSNSSMSSTFSSNLTPASFARLVHDQYLLFTNINPPAILYLMTNIAVKVAFTINFEVDVHSSIYPSNNGELSNFVSKTFDHRTKQNFSQNKEHKSFENFEIRFENENDVEEPSSTNSEYILQYSLDMQLALLQAL